MRRIFLVIVLAVFIYSLFRDMSAVRALILCAGVVGAFAVSRIPLKHIAVMRYPVIGLCLALTGGLLLYAPLRSYQAVRYACPVLVFFAVSFFLATLDEKAKKPFHEIVGLSLILLSSGYNLAVSQHMGLLLPLTVSTALFLFVLARSRLLPARGLLRRRGRRLPLREKGGGLWRQPVPERHRTLRGSRLRLRAPLVAFIALPAKDCGGWRCCPFSACSTSRSTSSCPSASPSGALTAYQPARRALHRRTRRRSHDEGGRGPGMKRHHRGGRNRRPHLSRHSGGGGVRGPMRPMICSSSGTPYGMEKRIVPAHGFRLAKIEARPFLGTSITRKVGAISGLLRGVLTSMRIIRREKPA